MGNWDNFYYEAYSELKSNGLQNQFNIILKALSESTEYRYRSTREKWNIALNQLNHAK